MPIEQIQEAFRAIFAAWGLPEAIRVDRGWPWGLHPDLPYELALWWMGLGIEVIWNRPCHPQENGRVERQHGVSRRWSEPQRCATAAQLQERLTAAARLQRERYPSVNGQSRAAAHPELLAGGRAYAREQEERLWEVERVYRWFAAGVWQRRVDKAGWIYLYNARYNVGKKRRGESVRVRFEGPRPEWVIRSEAGDELRRYDAEQLTQERILALKVSHRKAPKQTKEVQLARAA